MGFIRAFVGALGGSFADQWKDFYTVPTGISASAGIFPAVKNTSNAGRGVNVLASENIITNGSKILVPDNTALITFENGALSGFIAEPGGYIYQSGATASASFFSGGGLIESVIKNSWERFKFGGMPGEQQLIFYVNLKEIPNNRFGTQSTVYWDDAYLGTQAGAVTRGTYTLKITDPITFVKNFVPVQYIVQNAIPFDFDDMNNDAAEQLFNEVVQSLSAAFSAYTNDPSKGNRIARLQADSVGFAQSLSAAVEAGYHWSTDRGLTIVNAALQAIEYDEATKALLADVQKADALMGARGNSFLQQSVARGMEAAGSSGSGAVGIGMMGMGMGAAGGAAAGLQQQPDATSVITQATHAAPPPPTTSPVTEAPAATPADSAPEATASATPAAPVPAAASTDEDPYEKLTKLKGLLDAGVITEDDFNAAKKNLLGL